MVSVSEIVQMRCPVCSTWSKIYSTHFAGKIDMIRIVLDCRHEFLVNREFSDGKLCGLINDSKPFEMDVLTGCLLEDEGAIIVKKEVLEKLGYNKTLDHKGNLPTGMWATTVVTADEDRIKEASRLLESIIDNLIEYENGGSDFYSIHDIAKKAFKLRELLFEDEN